MELQRRAPKKRSPKCNRRSLIADSEKSCSISNLPYSIDHFPYSSYRSTLEVNIGSTRIARTLVGRTTMYSPWIFLIGTLRNSLESCFGTSVLLYHFWKSCSVAKRTSSRWPPSSSRCTEYSLGVLGIGDGESCWRTIKNQKSKIDVVAIKQQVHGIFALVF